LLAGVLLICCCWCILPYGLPSRREKKKEYPITEVQIAQTSSSPSSSTVKNNPKRKKDRKD